MADHREVDEEVPVGRVGVTDDHELRIVRDTAHDGPTREPEVRLAQPLHTTTVPETNERRERGPPQTAS